MAEGEVAKTLDQAIRNRIIKVVEGGRKFISISSSSHYSIIDNGSDFSWCPTNNFDLLSLTSMLGGLFAFSQAASWDC